MKESLLKYIYTFVFFMSCSVVAFAQEDIDPHPADDDLMPAAPFDIKLLVVIMVIGIAFALYTINKRKALLVRK